MIRSSSTADLIVGHDGLARPRWAATDQLLQNYYDNEWGFPVRDERGVFERLSLEVFQSGLSWAIILRKREAFRKSFDYFDPELVSKYDQKKIDQLLQNPEIIRNRAKILATVKNAKATMQLRSQGGLSKFIWNFATLHDYEPKQLKDIPNQSEESKALSTALKKKGFSFVGPINMFATMEAIGMVNTHLIGSHRR